MFIQRFLGILAMDYGKSLPGQDITIARAVEVIKQVLEEED